MTSEYTPTTGAVRANYAGARYEHSIANCISMDAGGREFDRWLTAHDAEVAAEAVAAERERCARIAEAAMMHGVAASIRGGDSR